MLGTCRCKRGTWQAWQSPVDTPTLHVEGKCVCPNDGREATLRRATTRAPSEHMVILELVVTPSDDAGSLDEHEIDVYYCESNSAIVTEVVIENCGISLPVEQIG